jgi:hypothetical protein
VGVSCAIVGGACDTGVHSMQVAVCAHCVGVSCAVVGGAYDTGVHCALKQNHSALLR